MQMPLKFLEFCSFSLKKTTDFLHVTCILSCNIIVLLQTKRLRWPLLSATAEDSASHTRSQIKKIKILQ